MILYKYDYLCLTIREQTIAINFLIFYLAITKVLNYLQMTLAGISKRGYHIKKEQKSNRDISTIASCVNFVDEEENAKHKVRPCPVVTVVKLAKNDQVYLQEIDDNSTVLYSNTVFGLIRIGN